MLDGEAVVFLPLDEANPDRHLSEVEGIRVDLDAEELMRPDLQLEFRQTAVSALDEDFLLQVLEHSQGDVQEVPRSASRVQHADRSQAIEEGVNETLRFLDSCLIRRAEKA